MRFSRYLISSEQMSTGEYVLIAGNTGAMTIITEDLYAIVEKNEDCASISEETASLLADYADIWMEMGILTELTAKEELTAAGKFAKELFLQQRQSAPQARILPTLNCNYRCPYCFEGHNDFRNGKIQSTMTREQVDAAFAYIDTHRIQDQIILFGGEPLLKENRKIVDYIVQKGLKQHKTFFAITNGHDLNAYLPLLSSAMIDFVQITMDGPKEIHDRRKITLDHSSSYDTIMKNIALVLENTDIRIAIRANADRSNLFRIIELMDDLQDRGILDHPNLEFYIAPVKGLGSMTVTEEEFHKAELEIYAKYPEFKDYLTNDERYLTTTIAKMMSSGTAFPLRSILCGAPIGELQFAPDGKVYSCSSCVGFPDLATGYYSAKGVVLDEARMKRWENMNLSNMASCLKCRYAFLCTGSCDETVHGGSSCTGIRCDFFHRSFPRLLASLASRFLPMLDEE